MWECESKNEKYRIYVQQFTKKIQRRYQTAAVPKKTSKIRVPDGFDLNTPLKTRRSRTEFSHVSRKFINASLFCPTINHGNPEDSHSRFAPLFLFSNNTKHAHTGKYEVLSESGHYQDSTILAENSDSGIERDKAKNRGLHWPTDRPPVPPFLPIWTRRKESNGSENTTSWLMRSIDTK